jgi:predicted type IV restriction endonuclease
MAVIPKKVDERINAGMKRFQPIVSAAKARDVGESDTVTIVTDMLADIFGYDKYAEITSEHAIKGTYCDLAIKLEGGIQSIIEVKAIGIDLKDQHVKQAVDYAANKGVEWAVLTNGVTWRVYKVLFLRPIDQEMVIEFDFLGLNPRSQQHIDLMYLFCKEGWAKSVLGDFHTHKQALSRFVLGAIILSDAMLDAIRRELRRLSPEVRIESAQIKEVLAAEVLKREVLEGEKAELAAKKVAKVAKAAMKAKAAAAPAGAIVQDENTESTVAEVPAADERAPLTSAPEPGLG